MVEMELSVISKNTINSFPIKYEMKEFAGSFLKPLTYQKIIKLMRIHPPETMNVTERELSNSSIEFYVGLTLGSVVWFHSVKQQAAV